MSRRRTNVRASIALVMVMPAGALPVACAQAPPPAPAIAVPLPVVKPEELLAREITRIVLMDLRLNSHPQAQDYRVAEELLTLAHEMNPGDADMLRRAIEAASNADDQQKVLELSRELLRMASEAGDTVAQVRLITSTIAASTQSADERLPQLEAYLSGPKKQYFDDSVRSRLALDAALLLRERGDTRGFVEKLNQAVQLDRTHKEAAAMGAAFYAERMPNDRAGAMEWLVILLIADPVDPNVHMTIARDLASAGAYKAARRFHTNAYNIAQAAGGPEEDMGLQRRVLDWYIDGPGPVVTAIQHQMLVERDAAARELRRLVEAKQPVENAQKPEDLRLPMPLATMSILGSLAVGDDAAAADTMAETVKTVEVLAQRTRDAVREGRMPPAEGESRTNQIVLELQSIRLWSGLQVDEAQKTLGASPDLPRAHPEAFAVLDGWLKLRTGNPAGALAELEPIAERSSLAELGVASAKEALGDKAGAIASYRQVLRSRTLDMAGAWARTRLTALGEKDDPALAQTLEKVVAGVPEWVDRLTVEPRKFVEVTSTAQVVSPEAIERTPLEITITNVAPVPLAFGADRPISSRFLLAPKLDGGDLRTTLENPEVVDINRRLRLMPRERLTVTVWPDPGESGWLMEALADRTFRVRWRAVQGFRFDAAGGYQPGPMCVATETESVVKRPLPEASMTPAELAGRVTASSIESLPRLAFVARAELIAPLVALPLEAMPGAAPVPAAAAPEALKPVIEAFVARYPTLPAVQRAIIASIMPHARLAPVAAPLDEVIRADGDPLVQAIVLLTRVTAPDDPVLARAAESPDARVKAMAGDIVERVKGRNRGYAQLKPEDLKTPVRDKGAAPAAGAQR